METLRVWHAIGGPHDGLSVSLILRTLALVGVDAFAPAHDETTHAGILVFSSPDADVFDQTRELSAGGRRRLLAVHVGDSGLDSDVVWRLLAHGAGDVVSWNGAPETARAITARLERWAVVDRLLDSPLVRENLVGSSAGWTTALRRVVEFAYFSSAPVVLMGETGTGKELVARLIHTLDPRALKRELVVLDCTTIVPTLSGSEFFGHERGAFTGAVAARDGSFALAAGGTLFLDEIGELPLSLQAELLRVVQERTYKRVGSNVWRQTEFRLICATNRDLAADVEQRTFRRDLYFRLACLTCRLPSLRERPEDVIPLARHCLTELCAGQPAPDFDSAVREYLVTRPYPGNVRELRQLMTRIAARHVGPGPITVGDLPEEERPAMAQPPREWRDDAFDAAIQRALALGVGLKAIGRATTETAVRLAVADEAGSLKRAARKLGVTDRALQLRRAQRHASGSQGSADREDDDQALA
jgi:transcriptional regulator with GAF, ATPase, and Fis domain